jgi:hypothetical protein
VHLLQPPLTQGGKEFLPDHPPDPVKSQFLFYIIRIIIHLSYKGKTKFLTLDKVKCYENSKSFPMVVFPPLSKPLHLFRLPPPLSPYVVDYVGKSIVFPVLSFLKN